jgi:hypothetical protein
MSESQQQSKSDVQDDSHDTQKGPVTGRRPSRNERRAQRAQPAPVQKQQQQQEPVKKEAPAKRGKVQQPVVEEEEKPRRLSLAEMFRDDNDDAGDDSDDVSKPPKDLSRALKRLNLKPEQFDDVLIDVEGQAPMPFKTLRSRVGELLGLETEQVKFESHRLKAEGEIMRSREEMRAILSMIPPDKLTPALIDKVRTQHAQMQQRERQSTLDVIPAWNNQETMEKDTAAMRKFVGKWGFDSNWLDQITDHRAIKFIRDMYLRDVRIEAALSQVTIPEDSLQRGSAKAKGKGGTQKPQEEKQQGTRRSRVQTPKDRLMSMFTKR